MRNKFKKIGLALGGGGARGLAHIGVLEGLKENGIPIDMISGTSAGAIVGSMYAATLDPEWISNQIKDFLNSENYKKIGLDRIKKINNSENNVIRNTSRLIKDFVSDKFANNRNGLLKAERLKDVIAQLLPVKSFDDLKIPFTCVATDLQSGNDVVFNSGDLVEAVLASSLVPGFIQPVVKENQILIDGGVSQPLPVEIIKNMGAELIIGVSVEIKKFNRLDSPNLIHILARIEQITSHRLAGLSKNSADIVIQPDTKNLVWSEFDKIDELIQNGKNAVCNQIQEIESKREKKKSFLEIFGGLIEKKN